jgi:hypothetical protein
MLGTSLRVAFVAGVGALLGGCPATAPEVRDQGGNRAEFTSAKAPDRLAGCVADAWAHKDTAFTVTTTRREVGWTVTVRGGEWTTSLADITPNGPGSRVAYSSNFDRVSQNERIPAIKACL